MKVAVTGHRPQKLGRDFEGTGPIATKVRDWLRTQLRNLQDPDLVAISGMALGVDQWFAEEALKLDIPVLAAVPFESQEKNWPENSRSRYWDILSHPKTTKVVVSEGGYAAWKMQTRNEWMVDRADLLLAVWNGSSGGTANCLKYAREQDIPITRLDSRDLLKRVRIKRSPAPEA